MVGTIARKELTDAMRDGRFRWASLILTALMLLSAGAAWRGRSVAERERAAAAHVIDEAWVNQGEKTPHSAAHYGTWVFKPSTVLSVVDPGIEPYAGSATFLEAHRRNEMRYRAAADGTSAQRFGSWSAAAVLQVLVPLLIVIVAFPAFAGEREQGTLRQLASLGVSMRDIALGKALGVGGALVLPIVPVAMLGALVVAPERVVTLTLLYLAYFAVVLAIALTVSARAPSARTALVILLGLWTFTTLVVPRATADLARTLYPTPSSYTFARAIETDVKRTQDGEDPRPELQQFAREHAEKGPPIAKTDSASDDPAQMLQQAEAGTNLVYDYHYDGLERTYRAQSKVHALATLASPMVAVRSLSMAIAGTDLPQHLRFANATETHRRMMIARLNGAMSGPDGAPPLLGEALWRSIPSFSYAVPALGAALAPYRLELLIFALWVVVAALLIGSLRRVRIS
jgi:ABC-2 type transport system permease protein